MDHIEPAIWTDTDRALWARIAAHDFEPAGDALTFTGRLARDHGWSLAVARGAVAEYRRFCFLALHAGSEVTPSEEVDEVWHQHLTFSRDYWRVWCAEVLRADLHHQPTRGGAAEGRRFISQYAETLARYEAWFGPPPAVFWPGTSTRFGRRPSYRMVDTRRTLILPLPWRRASAWLKSLLVFAMAMVTTGPARAEALGVLDWTAVPFLTFYVAAAALSLSAARYVPLLLAAQSPRVAHRRRLEPVELALLAGGRARAADVLTLEAIAAGDASMVGTTILVGERKTDRANLAHDLSVTLDTVQRRLADGGLAFEGRRDLLFRVASFAVMTPVLALGVAKLGIGVSRDKPVGFLLFLVAVTGLGTIVTAAKRRPTSRAGRQALRIYRDENDRAIRAPRPDEVIAAFACVGAAALVGSAFESYGELLKAAGDGGGGGDGGGCGGGCGGCGG